MKKVFCIIICLFTVILCTGCSGGIKLDEVKNLTAEYLGFIKDGNYEDAAALFHPTCEDMSAEKLKEFTETVGKELEVDFSAETENIKVTSFDSALYSGDVKGSKCDVKMTVDTGGKNYTVTVGVIRNNDGYGMYNITFGK